MSALAEPYFISELSRGDERQRRTPPYGSRPRRECSKSAVNQRDAYDETNEASTTQLGAIETYRVFRRHRGGGLDFSEGSLGSVANSALGRTSAWRLYISSCVLYRGPSV
ncbi:hypothetical protein CCR75_005849 [Bremia lactucae]|uniref:Uncharacterized protein n=1 Tax=Bremia lactucae TaxID=4779 RepID=A0A976FGJ6_BRELC|nr:hypothetical protein CCR75_005849 [Bremia lactucae]